MTYRVTRNGQIYGPYTLEEIERYLASGNIVPQDFAQAEGAAEWTPVAQLLSSAAYGATGPAAPFSGTAYTATPLSAPGFYAGAVPANFNPQLFPDPPDLPWWLALILGIVTGGVFFVVWDIVQAAWMRKIEPRSTSLYLYIAAAFFFLLNLQTSWHSVGYWVFHSPFVPVHHSGVFGGIRFVLWLAARFVLRSELLTHFNTSEPIGLRLNGFLTLILGGLYFQFHFNQINAIKRSMRTVLPTP